MRFSVVRLGAKNLEALAKKTFDATAAVRTKLVSQGAVKDLVQQLAQLEARASGSGPGKTLDKNDGKDGDISDGEGDRPLDDGLRRLATDAVAHLVMAGLTREDRVKCVDDGATNVLVRGATLAPSDPAPQTPPGGPPPLPSNRRALLALSHLVTRCDTAQRRVLELHGSQWLCSIARDPPGGDPALRLLSLRALGELAFQEENRLTLAVDAGVLALVRSAAGGAYGHAAAREARRVLHILGPPTSREDEELMAQGSAVAGSTAEQGGHGATLEGDGKGASAPPLFPHPAHRPSAYSPLLPHHSEHRTRRILTIDGGGTRAVATIELLKRIRDQSGKDIHELFDMIVGTSTGAILAVMVALRRKPLEEIEQLYLTMAQEVFWKPSGQGTVGSYTQTAYQGFKLLSAGEKYSHATLARVLEEYAGTDVMIDAAVDCPGIPRVLVVSTIASHSPPKPFIFRSFAHSPGRGSRYEGSAQFRTWEALRASTAAPTFFIDMPLDGKRLIDGGIVANNPTAIAVHEARRLWGDDCLRCVVSLGTGGFAGVQLESGGWGSTVNGLLEAMTSTDVVHHAAEDLLPQGCYFRFNPEISPVYLDENDTEKLRAIQQITREYVDAKADQVDMVCDVLLGRDTSGEQPGASASSDDESDETEKTGWSAWDSIRDGLRRVISRL